jgi:hypothetical protein
MTATTRIYAVTPKAGDKPATPRLVRAPNSAQALRHIASEWNVTLASQDDLVKAISAGAKVEDAKPDEPN